MPNTKDIGRLYWHLQRYPDLRDFEMPVRMPRFTEPAYTNELEEPYRFGEGRVFRLWPTRWAIVVGVWFPSRRLETEALLCAMSGRNLATALTEIKQWPGQPSEEIPEELMDSIGVIAYTAPEAAE